MHNYKLIKYMLKLSSVFTNEIDPFSPEYLVWNLEKMRKGNGR